MVCSDKIHGFRHFEKTWTKKITKEKTRYCAMDTENNLIVLPGFQYKNSFFPKFEEVVSLNLWKR